MYYDTFNSFDYTIQKIDFFRYVCVYHYGGFYFDIDVEITKSIEPLCKYECVFPKESYSELKFQEHNLNFLLGNYGFGASTKNSFIKLCIDNIINNKIINIPNYEHTSKQINMENYSYVSQSHIDNVLYTTGPILVSQSYIDYQEKNNIKIIEPTPFKIYSFGDYGNHLAIGTWKGSENVKNYKTIKKDIIFSCTTYLKNDEKFKTLKKTLDTFIQYNQDDLHLIDKYLVIMEYSENNNIYIDELRKSYPEFTFIDKDKNNKGQANSLNMIIDKLSDYKFWLHWEDSWYSIGPTLRKTYNLMNSSEINHMQLTKKDLLYNLPEVDNDHIKCINIVDYKMIKANYILKDMWKHWEINDLDWSVWKSSGWWPFFSLRPSMNKVDVILNTGYFNTQEDKWPFQFEFEWSLKWIRKNDIIVGIFKNINVVRDSDHVPTYDMNDYNKWQEKLKKKKNIIVM